MRFRRSVTAISALVSIACCGPAMAAGPATDGPPVLDYRDPAHWVCRPASCRDTLDATALEADGSTHIERFHPARDSKVDCFYVYPTVSHSPGLLAEPKVTSDERRAVIQQAERFSSVCRLFAPFYRQVTVTSMQRPGAHPRSRGEAVAAANQAYADVLAAWDDYMAHDNSGRGVILIGHSQGAGILIRVIQRRIDGAPVQGQLVSAVLAGAAVFTPSGRETGGTFKAIRPCRSEGQTGCVISFNMVRAEQPIPTTLRLHSPGASQVCTNPAALGGGPGRLIPYLSASGDSIIPEFTGPQSPWMKTSVRIATPFVTTPGLYTAECGGDGAFVAISMTAQPADARTGALTGDWLKDGRPEPTMGLHLVDLNLAQGNLVNLFRSQVDAYLGAHPRAPAAPERATRPGPP
jgi:hypothetical protein